MRLEIAPRASLPEVEPALEDPGGSASRAALEQSAEDRADHASGAPGRGRRLGFGIERVVGSDGLRHGSFPAEVLSRRRRANQGPAIRNGTPHRLTFRSYALPSSGADDLFLGGPRAA